MQTISTQEVGCALATQNLTAAQYAQMSSALSLDGETVSLTASKVQEAAATAGLTEAQSSAIVSTLGLSTAQKGLTASAIAAKVAVAALNAVLGLGLGVLLMGVSKALSAASDKIYEMNHKSEILKETIEGLNTETANIKTELTQLNDQLSETQEKLSILSAADSINITDQSETIELQKQNDLLEAQIALKERELELKNQEANKAIEDWYKQAWQTDTKLGIESQEYNGVTQDYYVHQTEEQYFDAQIARAKELYERQRQLDEHKQSLSQSDIASMTEEQIKALELTEQEKLELQEIQKYFTSISGELGQQISGYVVFSDEQQRMLDNWNALIIKAGEYSSYNMWAGINTDTTTLTVETQVDTEAIQTISDALRGATDDIDSFQSRLETVFASLRNQSEMTSTDIIDLMQDVSDWGIDFDWEKFGVTGERGVGDLNAALTELNDVLGEQINSKYPELSSQLNAISNDAAASASGFSTLSNALQTLSDHHSLLETVQLAIEDTGDISVETCNEIIAAYPQMSVVLSEYLSGVRSTSDVYASLQGAYQSDLDLYYQLILQKKELDYSFYQQVYDNLPSWVQSYLTAYQQDYGNFKSLAEAKLKLQAQFLRIEASVQNYHPAYQSQMIATKKAELQSVIDTINQTELEVANIQPPTFNVSPSSGKSGGSGGSSSNPSSSGADSEPSIKEIDWAAHSIDNITHHIEYLDNALNNADGYKQREVYLKKLIGSQNLYNESLDKQAELYRKEYLEAVSEVPEYRKLIESGATFKVEEFVDQDDLYESITEAQKLYTSWRDINTAQQDAVQSLKEYEDQLHENIIEHLASEIQLIQNDIDGIESALDADTEFHIVGDDYGIVNSWKKEKYEQLILLSSDMQEMLEKKLAKFQSRLSNIDPETDDYYELQDQIAECEQAINDCVKSQREYNSAILSLPLTQYQKQLDLVDRQIDLLEKVKDKYANYISAVTYSIDEEIDSITDSKESLEDYYDSLIEPIQNQLDTMQETNDERERALALQQAYYDLEKAKNNLSVKTYVEGQGFVYRADDNAIREAQDALDTALYDKAVDSLQEQITGYETTRDALLEDYDEELDRLNRLKDSWSNIISEIESLALVEEFKVQFGDSTLARIIDGRDTSTIQNVTQWVTEVQTELDSLNVEKEGLEELISTCQLIVDSYEDGSMNLDLAMNKMNQVVAGYTGSITALHQQHINSVIDLSNQYISSLASSGDAEIKLSENVENSNNKITSTIARACSQIKTSYNGLLDFIASFRADMLAEFDTIRDSASGMAASVAASVRRANDAIASMNAAVEDAKKKAEEAEEEEKSSSSSSTKTSLGSVIKSGISTIVGAIFKHDGMESGLVSKDQFEANRNSVFKRIALDDLEANEVPAVLQVGEAVLTKKQQNNVVRNMIAGVDYGMKFAQGINKTSSVNINIPEIHVHEVQNADALANEIAKSFKTRMIQEVRK